MTQPSLASSPGLTILVNSTDRYADCWEPFFTLFAEYWPNCPYPIVLNTETRAYEHPGLDIRASRVGSRTPDRHPTWGESVDACLDQIETPYLLYLQEDYFLNGPVDVARIERFVQLMDRCDLIHVRLMELGGNEPYRQSELDPDLWAMSPRGGYLISLQAGLWRTASLRGYLREHENPWQFERWGSVRARPDAARFLCQSLDAFNRRGRLLVPYTPTGIVRGRWYEPAVIPLFADHGIAVDFSQRGFYRPGRASRFLQRVRTRSRRALMRATT